MNIISKILVCTNDSLVEGSIVDTFSRSGYSIEIAHRLWEAAEKMLQQMYDIVILDLSLAKSHTEWSVKFLNEIGMGLPIVLVINTDVSRNGDMGQMKYKLPKPFSRYELERVVNTALTENYIN
jgi:DNA-binding response OmpR family regulator